MIAAVLSHPTLPPPPPSENRGDIWITAGYEVEDQSPPERQQGRGDVQRVSLHHIMLDSRPGQGLRPNHVSQWTGWQTAASVTCILHSSTQEDGKKCTIQPSNRNVLGFVGRFHVEDLMNVDTVKTLHWSVYDRTRSVWRTANSTQWSRAQWSSPGGWMEDDLDVHLLPFKNRRKCDDWHVRSEDQNSEKDGSHFLVAGNDATRCQDQDLRIFSGTWNVLMS